MLYITSSNMVGVENLQEFEFIHKLPKISFSYPLDKNSTSFGLSNFFIHCESNGISSRHSRGYHHRRCISSAVGCILFRNDDIQGFRFDDIHAFRRDLGSFSHLPRFYFVLLTFYFKNGIIFTVISRRRKI